MQKSLITGVTGFVGKYLTEHLLSRGHQVYGVDRWDKCPYPRVEYAQADILDTATLSGLIARIRPDHLYHLAAISYLPDADASPLHSLEINIIGSVSVLDSVKQASPQCRVLLVGSSKEYSDTAFTDAVAEETQPSPTNFYGISKLSAELIGGQYVRQYGLDVRFTRSFNHTGPGQPPRFVCSDWARQVCEIEAGTRSARIEVGDLDATIDFTDVRDVVVAYERILERGVRGTVYNVCSGKGVSLDWVLSYLTAKCSRDVEIARADKKLRAHKTSPRMVGDNSLLRSHTGWQAAIPMEKTLDDLCAYWSGEIGKGR